MPPYRAGPGGGLFGSNVYGDTRPKIDVGGAIDAITNTGLALVQSAYQRRALQAESDRANRAEARQVRLDQQADADRTYQRERQDRVDQQTLTQRAFDNRMKEGEAARAAQAAEDDFLLKGGHRDAHMAELPNVPGMTQLPAFAGSAPSTISYESQPAGRHFDVERSQAYQLDQAKTGLTRQAYERMGMTPAQAEVASRNPSIADNLLAPPAAGHIVQGVVGGVPGTYSIARDGSAHPVLGPGGAQIQPLPRGSRVGQRTLPSAAVEKVVGIDNMLALATEVRDELKGAIHNNVDATGRVAGVIRTPSWVKNLTGKGGDKGKDIRALIGNLYATVAKERSGSALTKTELDLLESYMPNENEDETNALIKANRFLRELTRIRSAKLKGYQRYGGYQVEDDSGDDPASDVNPWRQP